MDEVKILSAHAEGNPHPGTTYINVDGVTFQIQDKHVTVFFSDHEKGDAMHRVTFAKAPTWTIRRVLLTTAVVGVALGVAGWFGWTFTRQ